MIVIKLDDGRMIRVRQPELGGPIEAVLLSDDQYAKYGLKYGMRRRLAEVKIRPEDLRDWLMEKLTPNLTP